jgi:solute carrier family 25 phosphate transporter 3
MAKFVVYEKVAETIYQRVDKSTTSDAMQTTINLGSGLIAGFAAALVSQPADTMLSKINKTKGLPGEGTTSRLIKIAKELGFRGSYTGIGARLFMVGTLTVSNLQSILFLVLFSLWSIADPAIFTGWTVCHLW